MQIKPDSITLAIPTKYPDSPACAGNQAAAFAKLRLNVGLLLCKVYFSSCSIKVYELLTGNNGTLTIIIGQVHQFFTPLLFCFEATAYLSITR